MRLGDKRRQDLHPGHGEESLVAHDERQVVEDAGSVSEDAEGSLPDLSRMRVRRTRGMTSCSGSPVTP